MPAATSSSCCRFVRCVFLSSSGRLYNCSKSLPAKQNVIKPPPTPPPPKEQAEQMTETAKTEKRKKRQAENRRKHGFPKSGIHHAGHVFRASGQVATKKARRNSARDSVVFFEQSENETQPSPTTSATSGRVRKSRAGRCFRSQGETALKEKNRQQDIKSSKNHPGK